MKKITYLILLLSLIVYISTADPEEEGCFQIAGASKKKCPEYTLTQWEKTVYGVDSCCYVTYKGRVQGYCNPVIKSKVKDKIKELEAGGLKNVKID